MPSSNLYEYFEKSAQRRPSAAALHCSGRTWSYLELWRLAERLSQSISAKGLRDAGKNIALLSERTVTAYAGLLGIMRSGNAFMPLNPRFPVERLLSIMRMAEPAALIVDPSSAAIGEVLLQRHKGPPPLQVFVESLRSGEIEPESDPTTSGRGPRRPEGGPERPSGEELAYLLFTSGSTGVPKGVPVQHRNACSCIEAVSSVFRFDETDRFTQFSELTFDISIAEMFICWKAGACLYAPTFEDLMTPDQFVNRHGITVWSSVPTLANNLRTLGALRSGALPSIRMSLFCGEALSRALAESWQEATPRSTVINLYGPTEASMFATYHVYDTARTPSDDIVPLGRPLPGFDFKVSPHEADTSLGELLLAGPQVVSGYWRNPEATKRAFLQFGGPDQERTWYRTGDLVRFEADHGLHFHGRLDHQVKVRGYRIEIQEIEIVLRRVTGSELVAVVPVYGEGRRCESLVAYCNRANEQELAIKNRCRSLLPSYMVPHRIMSLDRFPLNSNGKIDYGALTRAANDLMNRVNSTAPG